MEQITRGPSNEMNTLARLCVQQAQTQWRELDAHIAWCDERIAAHAKDNADVPCKPSAATTAAQPAHSGRESVVMTAHKRSDPILVWAAALRERVGWQKAESGRGSGQQERTHPVGGDATGRSIEPRHVSVKPGAPTPATA